LIIQVKYSNKPRRLYYEKAAKITEKVLPKKNADSKTAIKAIRTG